jgi:hypothetical protein
VAKEAYSNGSVLKGEASCPAGFLTHEAHYPLYDPKIRPIYKNGLK